MEGQGRKRWHGMVAMAKSRGTGVYSSIDLLSEIVHEVNFFSGVNRGSLLGKEKCGLPEGGNGLVSREDKPRKASGKLS